MILKNGDIQIVRNVFALEVIVNIMINYKFIV